MKIKKIGHCCLLIQIDGATILTDPGSFSTAQNAITGVDAVLITHEHGDHLHVDSVREIAKHNPEAKIFTNSGVGKQLAAAGIPYILLEGRANGTIKDVPIEAFDCKHEEIYEEIGQVQNTGYLIAGTLFYPGDSFFDPGRPVDVLALPAAGPWCKVSEAIRYALRAKPRISFPVHDAMLRKETVGFMHQLFEQVLKKNNIGFEPMNSGDEAEF